jgi:RHS repeat-associated protein
VKTQQDYYPFGMLMPERQYTNVSDDYRYGFNGMEKDDEVKGNSYDFGFRIYNSRLGRFLTPDPIGNALPFWSQYHFAANNPILLMDFEGLVPFFRIYGGYRIWLDDEKPQWLLIEKSNGKAKLEINLTGTDINGYPSPSIGILESNTTSQINTNSLDYKMLTKKIGGVQWNVILANFLAENPDIQLVIVGNHAIPQGSQFLIDNKRAWPNDKSPEFCCFNDREFMKDRAEFVKSHLFDKDLSNILTRTRFDYDHPDSPTKIFPNMIRNNVLLFPRGKDPVGTTLYFNLNQRDNHRDNPSPKDSKTKPPAEDHKILPKFR